MYNNGMSLPTFDHIVVKHPKAAIKLNSQERELLEISSNQNVNRNVGSFGIRSHFSGKRTTSLLLSNLKLDSTNLIRSLKRLTDFQICRTNDVFYCSITPEQLFYSIKMIEGIVTFVCKDDRLSNDLLGAISSSFFQDISWKYRLEAKPTESTNKVSH
jgi:hypothetical protein